jgi:hypothetical protein
MQTIYGLNLVSCFCNLLGRVYKVKPLCSWDSAFEVTQAVLSKNETMIPRCCAWGINFGCLSVNMCEWDKAWLWSECRVLIHGSLANLYYLGWTLIGPLVQGLSGLIMAKKWLNPWERSNPRQMNQVRTLCSAVPDWVTVSKSLIRGVYCSSLCVGEEDPLSLL